MSIDIDQDSKCLEGNSGARTSGSLYLIVGVGDEIIAALDPVEAKCWILHLSDDIFATIEAWHAAPKAADFCFAFAPTDQKVAAIDRSRDAAPGQ